MIAERGVLEITGWGRRAGITYKYIYIICSYIHVYTHTYLLTYIRKCMCFHMMGHGQTNRSAHTYIPRRMHIHERFRSSPREPQTEIPSPCATGGRPPQTCLASWGLRPLFLRQQREAVISLSIRRQIRKLPYIYIYITIYILFASSDPHPCETKLVANMCRFVLETIRCREVLRGLSRNFLCRLHVSICIGGYRCREVLRGLSRDFLSRLYVSICIGGYSLG